MPLSFKDLINILFEITAYSIKIRIGIADIPVMAKLDKPSLKSLLMSAIINSRYNQKTTKIMAAWILADKELEKEIVSLFIF